MPGSFGQDEAYNNCDVGNARQASSTLEQANTENTDAPITTKKKSGDFIKTLIVDQEEYDEYFTELFKSVVIGFLGFCTTCILIAFVVTMFCLKPNSNAAQ